MTKLRIIQPIGRVFGADEVFSGPGSFVSLASVQASKVFIIAAPSFLKNSDHNDLLQKVFKRSSVRVFEAPPGEPIIENMSDVFDSIFDFNPDWIIAIGGGSVIDLAKLTWIFYENPDLTEEDLIKPFTIPRLRGKAKFAAIPTTAGTGSEMSSSAVFQFKKNGKKNFAVSHELLPDIAVLDPRFIITAPRDVKINSALDALSHALEGYVSLFTNNYIKDLAELSCRNILQSIIKYVEDEDNIEIADIILRASNIAGIVQNISIPGLGHALSHQFARFKIEHGKACGFFLPYAMQTNINNEKVKLAYDQLSKNLGLSSAENLIKTIEDLNESLSVSIDSDIIEKAIGTEGFIEDVMNDPTGRANPLTLDRSIITKVLNLSVG